MENWFEHLVSIFAVIGAMRVADVIFDFIKEKKILRSIRWKIGDIVIDYKNKKEAKKMLKEVNSRKG